MEHEKVIDILNRMESEEIQKLVGKLNSDGIVSDEDDSLLSSYMIEHWTSECDSFISQQGYTGSTLKIHGSFFQSHGAVYVLFDEELHSYESAKHYMVDHVKNYEY